MIKIVFKEASGSLLIDSKLYHIHNNCVEFEISCWQLLCLSSYGQDHLQIEDILIEDVSIQHMKLLMFQQDSKECTFGWIDRRNFLIPLHPNYATFRSVVFSHINQGDFGSQIYRTYDFSLNNNPTLYHCYPKSIVDFFSQPTTPTWHKKFSQQSPWFLGPTFNRDRLLQEVIDIRHKFVSREIKSDSYNGWKDEVLKVDTLEKLYDHGLKYFSEILNQCKFTSLYNVTVGHLPPGGYINTHKDLQSGKLVRNKAYIPLEFTFENYFKFSPGGYVPLSEMCVPCLNTDSFLHGVINDSAHDRLVISCSGHAAWN